MPMNYTESDASIYRNEWFKNRVRVSTSTYLNYLLNTPTDDADYQAKIDFATRLAMQSEMVVNQLMFTLAGDSEVQAGGPNVDDPTLQAVVEKTIQHLYPIQPTTPPAMYSPVRYATPPPPPPLPKQ